MRDTRIVAKFAKLYAHDTGQGGGNMPMIVSCDFYTMGFDNEVTKTLNSAATDSDHVSCYCDSYIVRRLTPTECERLQGYPDGWTDIGEWIDTKGKKHKPADSPRYKALGNSIAIPPWLWVLSRLNEYCEEKTMASLFDGIGGFPLIWSFLNGKENCVWSSEIDSFCNAVSRIRFPE
jgi:site-specific DNA-cytosine methylase